MRFSENDFTTIVEAAADFPDYRHANYFVKRRSRQIGTVSPLRLRNSSLLPPWAVGLRRMLNALIEFQPTSNRGRAIEILCEPGVQFGLQELQATARHDLLDLLSQNAKRQFEMDLRRVLVRATRRCFMLDRASFTLALAAIGQHDLPSDTNTVDRRFLGEPPTARLFSLFRKFPVLPRIWFELISQCCDHIGKLLTRIARDRIILSRDFFAKQPLGHVAGLRLGMSDPHNQGATVTLVRFAVGSIIYKPRPARGESEWFSLLSHINGQSFQPRLRIARILPRREYCWMERIEEAPCTDLNAIRRYYQRLGGIIGAAYLVRAADCHRENIVAAGEHPVLVDAEVLWHSPTGEKSATNLLIQTGFFPSGSKRSLQSRSSVLGGRNSGQHVPKFRGRGVPAKDYKDEIITGFSRALNCVLRTQRTRAAFAKQFRRVLWKKRRWIYWPTEKYAAILRASIQPSALRSGIDRELLIARLCGRKTVAAPIIHAEIAALKRVDIPFFLRTAKISPDIDRINLATAVEALRSTLTLLK